MNDDQHSLNERGGMVSSLGLAPPCPGGIEIWLILPVAYACLKD